MLIFSEQENRAFEQVEDKMPRNAANAPNRRVIALLFRPGTRVDSDKWPCPRAKEGTAGCRKRFWSDGESRRTRRLPAADREYKQFRDTFACRFYDRIANNSPCDQHMPFTRYPVYFTVWVETLPVWDAPDAAATQMGQLARGTLVRVVAEKHSEDSFFIRFERTDEDVVTYYDAPRPSPKVEWICVSKDGERLAFWSNVHGAPLSSFTGRDLDARVSTFLDV